MLLHWVIWGTVSKILSLKVYIANIACGSGLINDTYPYGTVHLFCPYGTMREIVEVM
jgi:hypothetical protein